MAIQFFSLESAFKYIVPALGVITFIAYITFLELAVLYMHYGWIFCGSGHACADLWSVCPTHTGCYCICHF